MKDLKRGFMNFWQDRKELFEIPKSEIQKFVIGESFHKVPIYCYKVDHGERKILFVSAIHGNEIGTVKLAYFLLDYLSHDEKKYEKLTCFLVPCLNVDGFERARGLQGYFRGAIGRLNAKNVDLNRNFPTPNFRSRSYILSRKSSAGTFKYKREISPDSPEAKSLSPSQRKGIKNCGEFGGSELETRALMNLVEKEKISIIFSFHNSGRDVIGGRDELSKELVKIYANKTEYEILDDAEWRKIGQTGTAKDWCDDQNISFMEVEGSTRYGSDWEIQKPALETVLEYLAETA
ncbi:MAG: M14 family zinc carboxypeptidase [Patescibacteria group bacterium]|nr:M14 family zinc carboxypeptidase [Patescibacteria group bacterium]